METYNIKITYIDGNTESLMVKTPNLSMTMEQYQRNRDFFTWEIIEEVDEATQLEKDIKNGLYGEEY
tara:strand:- start:368 stop:568 length:201 start_codon:yes stop_codon:yes gene_type:complete